MKKFLLFIFLFTILIVGEYYFFNEIFSRQRMVVLIPSFVIIILGIYSIFRFAKKILVNPKQTKAHS
ncbi:MAG TPA: hypothetical protein VFZ78_05125 [Flavisolibacter sp.]